MPMDTEKCLWRNTEVFSSLSDTQYIWPSACGLSSVKQNEEWIKIKNENKTKKKIQNDMKSIITEREQGDEKDGEKPYKQEKFVVF